MAQRWGYRVESWNEEGGPGDLTTEEYLTQVLNVLGKDGWELIAVVPSARRGRTLLTFKKLLAGFIAEE
jgi:hypothetical protein